MRNEQGCLLKNLNDFIFKQWYSLNQCAFVMNFFKCRGQTLALIFFWFHTFFNAICHSTIPCWQARVLFQKSQLQKKEWSKISKQMNWLLHQNEFKQLLEEAFHYQTIKAIQSLENRQWRIELLIFVCVHHLPQSIKQILD